MRGSRPSPVWWWVASRVVVGSSVDPSVTRPGPPGAKTYGRPLPCAVRVEKTRATPCRTAVSVPSAGAASIPGLRLDCRISRNYMTSKKKREVNTLIRDIHRAIWLPEPVAIVSTPRAILTLFVGSLHFGHIECDNVSAERSASDCPYPLPGIGLPTFPVRDELVSIIHYTLVAHQYGTHLCPCWMLLCYRLC